MVVIIVRDRGCVRPLGVYAHTGDDAIGCVRDIYDLPRSAELTAVPKGDFDARRFVYHGALTLWTPRLRGGIGRG